MKFLKIILFSLLLFLSLSSVNGYSAGVKLDGGSSYNPTIDSVSNNGTILEFNFSDGYPGTSTGSYTIAFPAGFEKVSSTQGGFCDGVSIVEFTDTSFNYTVNPTNQFCVSAYTVKYKVTSGTSSGDHIITVLDKNFSNAASLTVGVTTSNTINSAETIDSDSDGYLDGYKLTFQTGGLTSFSNTNLKVGNLTPTINGTVTNNVANLSFTDGVYKTGELPDITDSDGAIFSGIGILASNSISETDKAAPIVLSVNSTNIVGVSSPTVNLNENSKLSINFSEKVLSSSVTSNFVIKENNVDITNSSYITFNETNGDTMYYCKGGYDGDGNCNTNFDSNKTYKIELGNNLTDWNSNIYTAGNIDVDVSIADVTPPNGNSVSYNGETNTSLVINGITGNNNYTNTNNGLVNLSINATDAGGLDKMCLSETSLTNNNSCSNGWINYSNTSSFTLTGNEGLKNIYIKYKDVSGNISSVYSDTIIWDKTGPSTNVGSSAGNYNNGNLSIALTCSDMNSSCNKIYYTTDGSTPTTSSSNVTSGNSININGINETIVVKLIGEDIVGNLQETTGVYNYIFSDSYITITSPISLTNTGTVNLNGTCNYALGSNEVEYSLNGSSYTNVTTDNCIASNTWSTSLNLLTNQSNTFSIRIKADNSINTSTNIINDNTAPGNLNFQINNNDSYTNSQNIVLSISASDTNGLDEMCISSNSGMTTNSICDTSWEDYNNTKNYTLTSGDETKTLYIKFKDNAGNISSIVNDSIILDSVTPTVSSNMNSGNYTGTKSVTLTTSGNNIYYSTDGSTPSNSSTLYSGAFNLGSTSGNIDLKVIAYSNGGLSSSVQSYSYNFGCFPSSVSNGTVTSYPSCVLTCNSGYTKSGNSCNAVSSGGGGGSSGGGGGGSNGGGSSSSKDYENISQINKKELEIPKIINKTEKKYGILKLNSKEITGNKGILKLRTHLKSLSNIVFNENTSVLNDSKIIKGPYTINVIKDLKKKTLKIENSDFRQYNIKKLFFFGNEDKVINFNKEVTLELNLGSKVDGKVYVFYSDKHENNFTSLVGGLEVNKDGIVSFKTEKSGYFAIIRDIYLDRIGVNIPTVGNSNKIDFENLKNNTLKNIKNTSIKNILNKNYNIFNVKDLEYYSSFDSELRSKVNKSMSDLNNFAINTQKYINTKDKSYKNKAALNYSDFSKNKEFKNLESKYVDLSEKNGKVFYKMKNAKYKKAFNKLEDIIITKFNKLLLTKTITQDTYNKSVNEYNDFVLNYSIYRKYKNKESKARLLKSAKSFIKVYKKKANKLIIPVEKTKNNKILIKDKYILNKELQKGDYNSQVGVLQDIMKSYGYFTYTSTKYYGNITETAINNFSKEILNINYNGKLTFEMINKINNLEYK